MRNKILVINPDYSSWPEWPVGMAYVLACLEKHGIPFDFLDCTTTNNAERTLRRLLARGEYFAVTSGGLIGYHRYFRHIASLVKEISPGTPFILGGHITKDGNNELLFDNIGVDFCILGEAEMSLAPFLDALARGERYFHKSEGIAFRDEHNSVVRVPPRRMDLNEENIFPAWHHFDTDYYVRHSSFAFLGKNLRYIPVLSGRGCIGKCGFCSPSVGGFKMRPITHVIEEIEWLIEQFEFDTICFLNEMFYPTARQVREFCAAYLQLPVRKDWFVQVRVDAALDVETLHMMREAGCVAVSAGIESGSNRILKRMNKKTNVEQIRRHFQNCRVARMPASGTVIIGYDGETEEDIRRTFDLLIEENISSGEALLFAYQGTAIYDKALAEGLIKDEREHLDAISGNLFRPTVKKEFCNMTAMPDNDFFSVALREVRRYNSHLIQNYAVRDLHVDIEKTWRWTTIYMAGHCSVCGAPITHSYTAFGGGFLGSLGPGVDRMLACRKCFSPAVFDPYQAVNYPDMRVHLKQIQERLARCGGVIILGVNNNLDFLLRSDIFGLDYSKILGVIPLTPSALDYYNIYPMYPLGTGQGLRAEVAICVDDSLGGAEASQFIEKCEVSVDEVLFLSSVSFRNELQRKKCLTYMVSDLLKKLTGNSAREIVNAVKKLGTNVITCKS